MQVSAAEREEEAELVMGFVVDAADTMVFGTEHPAGVTLEHPDAHFLIDGIVPEEGITRDLVQEPWWRSIVTQKINSVVKLDMEACHPA